MKGLITVNRHTGHIDTSDLRAENQDNKLMDLSQATEQQIAQTLTHLMQDVNLY